MATSTLGSGTLVLAGTTSGTTTVTATAVAGTTTLTLPAATDTLVGKATTDTLTNKTLTGAAMNGTLGATTPSTGAFTTLSATGAISTTIASKTASFDSLGGSIFSAYNDATRTWRSGVGIMSAGRYSIYDVTGAAEIVGISSAGLAVTGLTDISAATSGQIKFPATQNASSDANTLDDYEEGTWTPTIISSATYPTITYVTRTGQYTRVGRVCYFTCTVTMSAYSGGSGRVLTTGLPFTAAASNIGNGAPANTFVSFMDMAAGYSQITNYIDPSTTNFNWLQTGDNVSYRDMLVAEFQAATTFIVSGFYIVA